MHVILLISAKIGLIQGHLDLELTIDPAPPPPGEFSGLWFSYTLWYVAFRKLLIAKFCWGFKDLWAFKYVTISKIASFCIFNTKHPYIKLFK